MRDANGSRPAATGGVFVAIGAGASAAMLAVCGRVEWFAIPGVWFCLVPWLAALDRTRSLRGAAGAGILMSAAFVVAVFPWFPEAFATYTGAPWAAGGAALLALAPVLEPQFVTFAFARHLARTSPHAGRWWLTALIGAGVYVGTEWTWPKLFADTIAHPLHASALLRQAADLAGAHGLTFALILGNECVLAVLRAALVPGAPARSLAKRVAAPASCLVLLVVALAIYGAARLFQLGSHPGGAPVTAALIQSNIGHYDRLKAELGTFEAVRRILETHFALSREALERDAPDLLVWPETVYPTTFGTPKSEDGAGFDREIMAFVAEAGVPLVFGTYQGGNAQEFNAAVLLQPRPGGGVASEAYRKTRLFPFTERLPRPLQHDGVRRLLPWAGAWAPGDGPRVLALDLGSGRRVRIAPLICYDAVDPGFGIAAVRLGAELLVTLSNDSWFAYPGVQRLILIVSAFRSIETRRAQVRSTPTGVTALIDETGALRGVVGVDERGIVAATVTPRSDTWTLMLAWGDWFPPTAFAAAIVLLLSISRRRGPSVSG